MPPRQIGKDHWLRVSNMGLGGNMNKWKPLLLLLGGFLCLFLAAGIIALFAGSWAKEEPKNIAGPALNIKLDDTSNVKDLGVSEDYYANTKVKEAQLWVVYVTGAVRYPGVYKIHKDARVYELVEKAGGLTEEADSEAFNMAAPLFDGAHLHVPRKGDDVPSRPFVSNGEASGIVIEGKGQAVEHKDGKVDINRATAEELESLPGIGPKTAEAIIQYRDSNGPFKCVEDLLSVKGIGPKKLEKIKEHVTITY